MLSIHFLFCASSTTIFAAQLRYLPLLMILSALQSIYGDLAQTYTALLALGALRDGEGLSKRLDRRGLCRLLTDCQQEDGR